MGLWLTGGDGGETGAVIDERLAAQESPDARGQRHEITCTTKGRKDWPKGVQASKPMGRLRRPSHIRTIRIGREETNPQFPRPPSFLG